MPHRWKILPRHAHQWVHSDFWYAKKTGRRRLVGMRQDSLVLSLLPHFFDIYSILWCFICPPYNLPFEPSVLGTADNFHTSLHAPSSHFHSFVVGRSSMYVGTIGGFYENPNHHGLCKKSGLSGEGLRERLGVSVGWAEALNPTI